MPLTVRLDPTLDRDDGTDHTASFHDEIAHLIGCVELDGSDRSVRAGENFARKLRERRARRTG